MKPRVGAVTVVCSALTLAGCYEWTRTDLGLPSLVAADSGVVVRLTTIAGDDYELEAPRIVNDTIVSGWRNVGSVRSPRFDRPRVALADVRLLEVRGISALRTAGVVAAAFGSLYVVGQWILPEVVDDSHLDPTDIDRPRQE